MIAASFSEFFELAEFYLRKILTKVDYFLIKYRKPWTEEDILKPNETGIIFQNAEQFNKAQDIPINPGGNTNKSDPRLMKLVATDPMSESELVIG